MSKELKSVARRLGLLGNAEHELVCAGIGYIRKFMETHRQPTQKEIARRMEISEGHLSDLLHGKKRWERGTVINFSRAVNSK